MAEERIDIVVTDKVDGSIGTKLEGIATSADKGQSALNRLKDALAAVNTSALDRLAAAMSKVDSAQAKLINSQARLISAQNGSSLAAQKEALAQQKVATEAARTEAAQARAAAATSAAESAAMRLAAAQERLGAASSGAAAGEAALGNSVDAMRAKIAAGEGNIRAMVADIQRLNAANAGAHAPLGQIEQGLGKAGAAGENYDRAARKMTATNANIIAQLQDIGVSLAGGQNPLLVAIQQGSQLSYIASTLEGGTKQLIATIAKMALAWAPVIVALGAAFFALKSFNTEINNTAGIKEYVNQLGLTHAELKKLKDQHVTMMDELKAIWQVLGENLATAMGTSTGKIGEFFKWLKDKILTYMLAAFLGIGASAYALVKVMKTVGEDFYAIFYNAGRLIGNAMSLAFAGIANNAIDKLNLISGGINAIFGSSIAQIKHVETGVHGLRDGMLEVKMPDVTGEFNQGLRNGLATLHRIRDVSAQNARDRLKAKADEIKADRTGKHPHEKVDHTAENRAKALAAVNLKLDDELKRMGLLKKEREVQQRMDQIEEQLAGKKIHLNDEERKSILAKVQAVEDFKEVQASMDKIYTEIRGPAEEYRATLEAIARLHEMSAITGEQADRQRNIANRHLQEAVDPLFQMKEALDSANSSLFKFGDEANRAAYYEEIRQTMVAKGYDMSKNYVAGVNAEVDALMRKNDALQNSKYISDQAGGFINPALEQQKFLDNYKAIFAQIQQARASDVAHERSYQQALYALQAKYNEARLSAASGFFGALADITRNGSGVIGAIGKAAAVAQATIDGYVAVQKALASAPPPFGFIAAAAVALKTGAQVAGILSTNVGNFATGGQFVVQGNGGVDANNINMNVTRGERVTIETQAQQRANDGRQGPAVVQVNPKIVNTFDEKSFIAAMDSEDGASVIGNVIRRNKTEFASLLGVHR